MAKFNEVHWASLPDENERPEGSLWQILLKEPLLTPVPLTLAEKVAQAVLYVVTFRIENNRLVPFSPTDLKLFEDWKQRHKNTPKEDF